MLGLDVRYDTRLRTAGIVLLTLLGTILIAGSLFIWPYIMQLGSIEEYAGMSGALLWVGGIVSLILVFIGAAIVWFIGYYPLRTLLWLIGSGIVLMYAGVAISGVSFVTMPESTALGGIVAFFVNSSLAIIMSVLPSAIVTLLISGVYNLLNIYFHYSDS